MYLKESYQFTLSFPGSLKLKAAFASRLSILIKMKKFKNHAHLTKLTYQEPCNKGPDLCSPAL